MMILCRAQRLTLSFLGFYVVALAVSFPLQLTTARDPSVATGGLLSTKVNSALECENNQATQVLDGNQAISDFLQGTDRKKALEDFHVHGWRWHTLSLSRDSGRLTKLAKRTTTANIDRLQKAAEYVVGFNLKGLHKIEADLFFPWMKEKLTSIDSTAASQEFGSVMDLLEDDRRKIEELGQSITKSVEIASDENLDIQTRAEAIRNVSEASSSLHSFTEAMIGIEDSILVPAIAMTVPESEQQSFNNRVLRNLGLLDSRLHLVGMREAVWEGGDDNEKSLFEKAIPSLPQMMIPRWKRLLYDPQTEVLQ